MNQVTLEIDGMTCTSCSNAIENLFVNNPLVQSASISLSTNIATIVCDISYSIDDIINEIESIGFGATLIEEKKNLALNLITDGNSSASRTVEPVNIFKKIIVYSEKEHSEKLSDFANHLESNINGIVTTTFNISECQIKISYDPKLTGPRDFIKIAQTEFGLNNLSISSYGGFQMASRLLAKQSKDETEHLHSFLISLLFTIPIVTFTMILPMYKQSKQFIDISIFPGLNINGLVLFILSIPIQFYCGLRFHIKALKSIKNLNFGMDFLISVGTNAAFLLSFIGLILGIINGHANDNDVEYFDTSAVLITAVLLGKYLEVYTKGKTASAIHRLSSFQSKNARLVRSGTIGYDGQPNSVNESPSEIIIDSSQIHLNDILRLVEGEAVPADGILIANSSDETQFTSSQSISTHNPVLANELKLHESIGVDESMMTGESAMVKKVIGDKVFGGTIVLEGSALMQVTASGEESALGKILTTVQEAQSSKPPIQEVADQIARYFVPVISFISFVTFAVWVIAFWCGAVPSSWYSISQNNSEEAMGASTQGNPYLFAFYFALAVWVSACPCAFGLATPTAVLIASGVAAQYGVLVRKGAALQYAAEIDTIAFDKTGTLTQGSTSVSDFYYISSRGDEQTARCVPLALPLAPRDRSEFDMLKVKLSQLFDNIRTVYGNTATADILLTLQLLYQAEVRSSHPLAKGLLAYSKFIVEMMSESKDEEGSTSSKVFNIVKEETLLVTVIPGRGVLMTAESATNSEMFHVLVGSSSLLREKGEVAIPSECIEMANGFKESGKVAIYLAINGKVKAVIGVSDTVRAEARRVLSSLMSHGMKRLYMVTGDDPTTALAIGSTIGIPPHRILAGASPSEKEQFIAALQWMGRKVAFIGDGTNDSPALARANVGMSMSSGSDIALETSDMILCKGDLVSLLTALDLSKRTLQRIKLNYVWAFGYNLILVPLAAGCFYPSYRIAVAPMYAGLAMALSSVSVILSSLWLSLYVPPIGKETDEKTEQHLKRGRVSKDNGIELSGNTFYNAVKNLRLVNGDGDSPMDSNLSVHKSLLNNVQSLPEPCQCPVSLINWDDAKVDQILNDSTIRPDVLSKLRKTVAGYLSNIYIPGVFQTVNGIEKDENAMESKIDSIPILEHDSVLRNGFTMDENDFHIDELLHYYLTNVVRIDNALSHRSKSIKNISVNVIHSEVGCGCGKNNCKCGASCKCGRVD